MFIDFIAIGLLILSIIKGFKNGLVVAVFSLLAFVIGLAAALKLSAVVAEYLGTNTNISQRWLPILAFGIVFFVVVLLVRLGAKAIERGLRMVMLGWLNKLGGMVFYFLLYFFIFSILLFYATQLHLIKPETVQTSVTYPIVYPMAPVVMDALGSVIPFFKNMFVELENFFDHLSRKAH
ncbi:MAG TPA: CvpA family protein [Flavisolibacter sp.]|jgi:membrane protein required for colicin V production|nr:CvpA family protein [Flavisolibacter sp.]